MKDGLTQGQIAALTGIPQGRLSEYKTGKRTPTGYTVFAAFADGLKLSPATRQALGLDASSSTVAGMDVPQPRPMSFAEISTEFSGTAAQAAGNLTSLWRADLADQGGLERDRIDPNGWGDASLRWLVHERPASAVPGPAQ